MRKKVIITYLVCLFLASSFLWVVSASSQDYPKGNVQIVVPFAPGGAVDIFWRNIGDTLNKHLGAPVAFVNKTGGGGVVGTASVVNSKPDGYTLLGGTSDPINIAPVVTPNIPYDV